MVISEKEKLDKLLISLHGQLESHDRFLKIYAPQLAPDFNTISCFHPDENRLSAVIAMLLDPNGEHGQGKTFIRLFSEEIKINESAMTAEQFTRIDKLLVKSCEIVTAEKNLEVVTNLIGNMLRRIDILLEIDGFGLAFENKPWAGDQKNQVSDYLEYLEKRYASKNYLLIYLSPNGDYPSEYSIEKGNLKHKVEHGDIIAISYQKLRNWIDSCAVKCCSLRVRVFLEDFSAYIINQFEGGFSMIKEDLVVSSSIRNADNISAAVSIGYTWPVIAKALIQDLGNAVKRDSGIDENWEYQFDFDFNKKWTGFHFKKKNWNNFRISFCFGDYYANAFTYGISSGLDKSKTDDLAARITAKLGSGKRDNWPWFQEMTGKYWNWSKSEVPWVGIKDNGIPTVELIKGKLNLLLNVEDDIDAADSIFNSSIPQSDVVD